MGKKISSYQKLKNELRDEKERVKILKGHIYKILDGDFEITTSYKMQRKMQQDAEKAIWFGSVKTGGTNEND